jgi:antitoxin MazE
MNVMQSTVGKWGNSLAVRLPAEFSRQGHLREGSKVELDITPEGELRIAIVRPFNKPALLKRLVALQRRMPETQPVVESLRRASRF